MQDLLVTEAAASFREKFPKDKAMQDKAFSAAVKALSGETVTTADDPVAGHFESAFQSLQGVDLSKTKGDPQGSLAERVAHAQQIKESEFQQTFMVTAQEAAEVKSIVSKAKKGEEYNFSSLPADAAERLETLYQGINAKVGYAIPDTVGLKPIDATSDSAANSYIDQVNTQ